MSERKETREAEEKARTQPIDALVERRIDLRCDRAFVADERVARSALLLPTPIPPRTRI